MSTIACDFGGVTSILAVGTAIFGVLIHLAVTSGMSTFPGVFSHKLRPPRPIRARRVPRMRIGAGQAGWPPASFHQRDGAVFDILVMPNIAIPSPYPPGCPNRHQAFVRLETET